MAQAETGQDGKLARGAHTLLRARRHIARELPSPDERFRTTEMPTEFQPEKWRKKGIIQRVGEQEYDSPTNRTYYWYRTTQAAWRYIEATIPDHSPGPCDHRGVRTVEAGETYTCWDSDCDARFDRETAEAILGVFDDA